MAAVAQLCGHAPLAPIVIRDAREPGANTGNPRVECAGLRSQPVASTGPCFSSKGQITYDA